MSLVIRNGTIVDGFGSDPFQADVAMVQRTEGFDATIVSGVVVYRNGEATGALPGRLVRGPQPA